MDRQGQIANEIAENWINGNIRDANALLRKLPALQAILVWETVKGILPETDSANLLAYLERTNRVI